MYSDPYAMLTQALTSAFVVGRAMVERVACEHLAFMGADTWDIRSTPVRAPCHGGW